MTTTKNNEHKKLNFSSEQEQSQACLNSAEHEKNQGRKVLNVPNLRFPEFQGEWEKKSLGEIGDSFIGLTYKPTDVVSEGGLIVFRSSNIQNGCMDYKDIVRVNKNVKEKLITKKDDLLVCARNGSARLIGKNAILHEADANQTFGAFMMVFRSDKNHFVHQLLNTKRYSSQVSENLGARINQITSSDLSSFEFFFPTENSEMNKIAALLDLIDERIATQNKIIEDLKKLKSAIIEKEYSNKTKSFSRLGDFIEQISKRNKDRAIHNVLSVSNSQGFIQQSEQFENRIVASDDTSNYKIVERNHFAFNPARINVGSIARLITFEKGIVSPMYICFRTKDSLFPKYLGYYFESKQFFIEIQKRLEGSVRQCLSFEGLCNIPLSIPTVEVQQQIGKQLSTLVQKIKLETDFLELLQKQKKFLLHQMFI